MASAKAQATIDTDEREAQRADRRENALTRMESSALAEVQSRVTFLPTTMADAMRMADMMANSNFVPGHLRQKPCDCLAVIMIANRWGADPFAVALKTYFVKDGAPPAFEAQLVAAVINTSGALSGRLRYEYSGQGEALRCTVSGYLRADPNDEKTKTQSIARITTRNSPLWKTDPEQQLGYYTARAWARQHCPEVMLGIYTPDEEVDPERARNATPAPAMPRRDAVPEVGQAAPHDPKTGELQGETIDVVAEHSRTDPIDRRGEPTVEERMDAIVAEVEGDLAKVTDSLRAIEIRARLDKTDLTDETRAYLLGICNKRIDALRAKKA